MKSRGAAESRGRRARRRAPRGGRARRPQNAKKAVACGSLDVDVEGVAVVAGLRDQRRAGVGVEAREDGVGGVALGLVGEVDAGSARWRSRPRAKIARSMWGAWSVDRPGLEREDHASGRPRRSGRDRSRGSRAPRGGRGGRPARSRPRRRGSARPRRRGCGPCSQSAPSVPSGTTSAPSSQGRPIEKYGPTVWEGVSSRLMRTASRAGRCRSVGQRPVGLGLVEVEAADHAARARLGRARS